MWLTWNGSRFPHDLNLELYRLARDGPELVETSRRVTTEARNVEYLGATLPSGEYYLVLDVPERTAPHVDARPRVEVTASGVVLDRTTGQRERDGACHRPRGPRAAPSRPTGR
ncbi:hypothetical protein [Halogeometricum sp. CBA1124]|uniref:hypothetical protein n=1 Tax=Halogeometricum sp. CBA1124 TaxID=2668071 RepID=UPI0014292A7A|nr:hypothetical protein [Halogeometricum sp. CBA1124]MUV57328.1 hypothetical protein [Halogeometricum sp. CBA1124]